MFYDFFLKNLIFIHPSSQLFYLPTADFSLPAQRVIRALGLIIEWLEKADNLRRNNGSEYVGKVLLEWAAQRQITLIHIQPGKSQ